MWEWTGFLHMFLSWWWFCFFSCFLSKIRHERRFWVKQECSPRVGVFSAAIDSLWLDVGSGISVSSLLPTAVPWHPLQGSRGDCGQPSPAWVGRSLSAAAAYPPFNLYFLSGWHESHMGRIHFESSPVARRLSHLGSLGTSPSFIISLSVTALEAD